MYPLGLLTLAQSIVAHDVALKLTIALPSVLVLALLYSWASACQEQDDDGPPFLALSLWETIWPFFTTRHDFLMRGFELTGQPVFRFKLLQVGAVKLPRHRM